VLKCRNRAAKLIFQLAPVLFLAVDSAGQIVPKNLVLEKLLLCVQLSAQVHFRRGEDMYKAYIKQTKCHSEPCYKACEIGVKMAFIEALVTHAKFVSHLVSP